MKTLAIRLSIALFALLPLSARVSAACAIMPIAELPVTMSGHQPLVFAKINGTQVQFLADSGAFYSMITASSAAELKLHLDRAPPGYSIRGVGGLSDPWIAKVKTFTLAGVNVPNISFLVSSSETGGVGALGQNVLGLGDVEYDLGNGMIRLLHPQECKGMTLAYWAAGKPISTLPISTPTPGDQHTIGTVTLNGVPIRAIFDTGASSSILTLSAAARAGIKPGDPGVKDGGYLGGIGSGTISTWIAPFASFKIGGEEIRNAHLRIGNVGLTGADMLIGADFFLSHRVYVANSQRLLYFTYSGGPVFNLKRDEADGGAPPSSTGATSASEGEPKDADGFARRGAAFAARREFARAIADLTRASEMAPTEPRYFIQRAQMRMAARQPFLALADLDQALRLKPDAVPALILRAEMRTAAHDTAGALSDLDAAARSLGPEADRHLALAHGYERADAFDRSISEYDLWLAHHGQDGRAVLGLNGRAWTRAIAGRDLDKALRDANAALKLQPREASILDTRGLIKLRLGQLDAAIVDYDAALALEPKVAWSLYGRGLAKIGKGAAAEGKADIAAAVALDPDLPAEAKHYGLGQPPA